MEEPLAYRDEFILTNSELRAALGCTFPRLSGTSLRARPQVPLFVVNTPVRLENTSWRLALASSSLQWSSRSINEKILTGGEAYLKTFIEGHHAARHETLSRHFSRFSTGLSGVGIGRALMWGGTNQMETRDRLRGSMRVDWVGGLMRGVGLRLSKSWGWGLMSGSGEEAGRG
jgi:hypothetical protein